MTLNFISMFIVMPALSGNMHIFGIYTACIAFTIFLSYADFGFIPACQRMATKYVLENDINREIEVVGFVTFILLIISAFLSLFILSFSIYPELYVKGILNSTDTEIAKSLFRLLFVAVINYIIQKIIQFFFSNRYEDYKFQIVNILINIFRIISVFYFFDTERYDIVGYYLFYQIVAFCLLFSTLIYIIIKNKINLIFLLTSIKFNKKIFLESKSLAFSGLLSTILWILYYEIDVFYITKIYGITWVAYYTVGFTILSLFRGFFGILYSPFVTRFNELIYQRDFKKIKNTYFLLINLFAPFIVVSVLLFAFNSKIFTITWVGIEYEKSISLLQFLVLVNIYAFVNYPTNILLYSLGLLKKSLLFSFISTILYWLIILNPFSNYDFKILALAKFILFTALFFYNLSFLSKFLKIRIKVYIKNLISNLLLPILFTLIISLIFNQLYTPNKSKEGLLIFSLFYLITFFLAIVLHYFSNREFKFNIIQIKKILLNVAD